MSKSFGEELAHEAALRAMSTARKAAITTACVTAGPVAGLLVYAALNYKFLAVVLSPPLPSEEDKK